MHGNEDSSAIYVYCFAGSAFISSFEAVGIDGSNSVFLLPRNDVVAIATLVSAHEFSGITGENGTLEIARVGRLACRHEEVVEKAMLHSPILPMRFGTIFDSVESLHLRMQKHHNAISAFLDWVSGKDEWSVKALLNRAWTSTQYLQETQAFPGRVNPQSPGAGYLKERKMRASCQDEVDRAVEEVCKSTGLELCRLAVDLHVRKPLALEAAGDVSEMIVNWAFLLSRDKTSDFCARVDSVNERCGIPGLVFRISGPWPPYSFCPRLEEEARR